MNKGQIVLIAAVAKNNVIGNKNNLPWRLPEDLKHFKALTLGHIVLMGRKTFEAIIDRLGHPLPDRTNIVITRQSGYEVPKGVQKYHSIKEAIALHSNEDIYVIGGANIYHQTIPMADKLFLTEIGQEYEGDAFFPVIDSAKFREVKRDYHKKYSFVTYEKI